MFIHYLAKVHNESFMKQVEFAFALWQKKQETQPTVGSARGPHHVRWRQSRKSRSCAQCNLYYKELLEYKEMHGDCCVPSVRNKKCSKEHERLARFVSSQRTLNKQDKVPPKRRELLGKLGLFGMPT
jgi:hypothetical protein